MGEMAAKPRMGADTGYEQMTGPSKSGDEFSLFKKGGQFELLNGCPSVRLSTK